MTNSIGSCTEVGPYHWAASGRVVWVKTGAAVACTVLLRILASLLAGRSHSLTLQDLDWQAKCSTLWLYTDTLCTDADSTRTIFALATAAIGFCSTVYTLFSLIAAVGDRRALARARKIRSFAAIVKMARAAPLLLKRLDKALTPRLPRKLRRESRSMGRAFKRRRVAFVSLAVLTLASPISAALTRAQCVGNNCMQRGSNGTMCYYPDSTDTPSPRLSDQCSNLQLRKMLEIHRWYGVTGPSVGYYEPYTRKLLGDASFSLGDLGHNTDIVACAIGARSSNLSVQLFQTRCWITKADEDVGGADGDRACSIIHEASRPLEPECNLGAVNGPHFKPSIGFSAPCRGVAWVSWALKFGHLE